MSERVIANNSSVQLRPFKRYPAYKDSGVEWLGRIPTHWEVKRLRSTITSCQNGVWGDEPDGVHDIACVRVADFDRVALSVDITQPTLRSIEPRVVASRGLHAGELLLEKSGGGENQPVGAVVLYAHDLRAVFSIFIARVTVGNCQDARVLTYLHAALYALRINTRNIQQSTGIQNLDSSSYLSEATGLPPEPEQRAIAGFLDRETARIDELVAKKKRVIELMEEERAAFVAHAVTRGLNPSAPLKTSGVEWLGEIPAHWVVRRTKFAARLRSGHTPSRQHPEYWENCTIPWFGLADVWRIRDGRAEYVSETAEKISELGLANSSARLLPKGTVILSRTASVGFSAIMGVDMATTQDFVNWVCGASLRPEYLLYVFRSMQQEFGRLTMGSTHQTIYMPDVGQFSMPIPPVLEQDEIVAFVRLRTKEIDALIGKVQGAIDQLREFRAALISAAVTGKIDVREDAA